MPFYQATISRVQAALAETFTTLYVWFDQPEEMRDYKPADNGWSINEILELRNSDDRRSTGN